MSQYITYDEFINSPYGQDYVPAVGELFETSGQVEEFLTYISNLIDLYCSRTFEITSYQDVFQGTGDMVMFLNNMPVTGISSVVYEDMFASSSGTLTNITDYRLFTNTGKLKFADPLKDYYQYTVNYVAGYTTVPDPIKQACLMLANAYLQGIDNGAVAFADGGANVQFRFNKFQEQYADPRHKNPNYLEGIPVTVQAILRRYRIQRHA